MARKKKNDVDFSISHALPQLIEPGHYHWQCNAVDVNDHFKRIRKAYLRGVIVPPSPCCGAELFMVINLSAKRAGIKSKMLQSWIAANWGQRPQRRDRLSTRIFKGAIFMVEVVTVIPKTEDEKDVPELAYSVVKKLLERVQ